MNRGYIYIYIYMYMYIYIIYIINNDLTNRMLKQRLHDYVLLMKWSLFQEKVMNIKYDVVIVAAWLGQIVVTDCEVRNCSIHSNNASRQVVSCPVLGNS